MVVVVPGITGTGENREAGGKKWIDTFTETRRDRMKQQSVDASRDHKQEEKRKITALLLTDSPFCSLSLSSLLLRC